MTNRIQEHHPFITVNKISNLYIGESVIVPINSAGNPEVMFANSMKLYHHVTSVASRSNLKVYSISRSML